MGGGKIEVVVKIGEKGRVTIPAELRRALGLSEGDSLRVYVRGGEIVLRPERVISSEDIRGILGGTKVDLEEVEGALGRGVE